jgi:hypothetical protein
LPDRHNPDKLEQVGGVIFYLSLLASSVSLKTPLPPSLPHASLAQAALIRKLRILPRETAESRAYYAYSLTMGDVIQELDYLYASFQVLYGVFPGSTQEFESMFV